MKTIFEMLNSIRFSNAKAVVPYIAVSCEIFVFIFQARRTLMKRLRWLELSLGWRNAVLLPGNEVGAIGIDRWVHLVEFR